MLSRPIDFDTCPIPQEYVSIDVETTGKNPALDRILEVAAVHISRGEILETFTTLVFQDFTISTGIQKLTGITPEMVRTGMNEGEVMERFCDFIQEYPLLGHNVTFDIRFLWRACLRHGISFDNDYFDTLTISKKRLPGLKHYKLGSIASALKIEQTTAHRAEADAIVTARCLEKLRQIHPSIDNPDELWPKQARYYSKAATLAGKRVWELTPIDKIRAGRLSGGPADAPMDPNHPLYGKKIVFTGEMETERAVAVRMAANVGAVVRSAVSKQTDYLVVGGQDPDIVGPSGKSKKERKADEINNLGSAVVQIIDEKTFLAFFQNGETK